MDAKIIAGLEDAVALAGGDESHGRLYWYHYVRHTDLLHWLAMGWEWVADLGDTHGQWSSLVRWGGEGQPPPECGGPPA